MSEVREVLSTSEFETRRLAQELVSRANDGECFGLCGELGAGKTAFVRGAVEALGGDPLVVRSPTFTLLNIYDGQKRIYHFDLYRLSSVEDLESIGFFDFAGVDGLTFVEWPERVEEAMKMMTVLVRIEFVEGFPGRRLILIETRRRHGK
jgi:tRNA threonylcarbamoyl adenosine modification protein YjeE